VKSNAVVDSFLRVDLASMSQEKKCLFYTPVSGNERNYVAKARNSCNGSTMTKKSVKIRF